MKEVVVVQNSLRPGQLLVIGPEESLEALEGHPVEEPIYGLPALWIAPELAEKASELGCGVFDPGAVLLSHLGEVIRTHAMEYLNAIRQRVRSAVCREALFLHLQEPPLELSFAPRPDSSIPVPVQDEAIDPFIDLDAYLSLLRSVRLADDILEGRL